MTEYRAQSTDDRVQSTEYRVQSTEYRLQSTDDGVQSTDYRVQITEYKANQILPLWRGSGSDAVADKGVETRGKAESRKKKAEIAKRKIACCYFINSLRNAEHCSSLFKEGQLYCLYKIPTKRIPLHPYATKDNYIALLLNPPNIFRKRPSP
ncbi:MAG: hypothetical protein IJB60_00220 [Bacteroidaceae bacterium]|nr:hypothetical protein [Bacteroidaceae bacterium]